MTIHWCGTGLSAIPGLRRLISAGRDVTGWNRSTDKARDAVGDLTGNIHAFETGALAEALNPGDVVVSMLPGDWHVPLAELCLDKGAHFVSSSYIAPEMRALDAAARDKGLCLVNEIGLDPGIGAKRFEIVSIVAILTAEIGLELLFLQAVGAGIDDQRPVFVAGIFARHPARGQGFAIVLRADTARADQIIVRMRALLAGILIGQGLYGGRLGLVPSLEKGADRRV